MHKTIHTMSKQFIQWEDLTERIADKVQEYIDERKLWGDDALLRVDGPDGEVELMENAAHDTANEMSSAEVRPVSDFITDDGNGTQEPDMDAIEEFADGWFDLRRAD